MIDNKNVGRKIAAKRQENGLTQQQLAAMMNVSHQAVSKWESGQTLPDIQTMLELTRFFGLTVEQLITDAEESAFPDAYPPREESDTMPEEMHDEAPEEEREGNSMSLQQLLQMAPYMSKETVEQIALEIDEALSANQIARLAPYIRTDCLEKLVERHHPEFTWESLRRLAPYMRRETVDALARDVASGRETIRPAAENINRALGDLGKAFDDIGHDMKHAVKKGLRFGKNVLREVSSALSDRGCEMSKVEKETEPVRSERAQHLRRRAFERAAADGKWDWIAGHIRDLDGDGDLRAAVAAAAKEAGMHDWICTHMGAYAEEATIQAAIDGGNWAWLGENARQMEPELQQKVARAACDAENWDWLARHSDYLKLSDAALELALAAQRAEQRELCVQLAENHLLPQQASVLAREACEASDFETLDQLIPLAEDADVAQIVMQLAEGDQWEPVARYLHLLAVDTVEALMELAVEKGNFEAVDLLDPHL